MAVRRSIAEVLMGAAVLIIAGGFLAFAIAHSGRTTTSGYPLHASFDHIDGLSNGADVRMAGVKIGSVTGERIDPKSYLAIVTMNVRDGIELPKDTAAVITSESLLGGKYLSLSPGGDVKMLKAGDTITITQSSVSLEQLLGKFIFSVTSLNGGGKGGQSGSDSPSPSPSPSPSSGSGLSGGLK
jgi:phospholipid/cholesterol/gamma-HCH transport system substrate-binding protein